MKILNIGSTFDPITGGGEAERSFQLTKYLTLAGAECDVLTLDSGLTAERKQLLTAKSITLLPILFKRLNIPLFSFNKIRNLVKKADLIHLMGHWSLLNALAYIFIRIEKKPYVVCPAGSLIIFGRSKLLKKIYNLIIGKQIIRNASTCIAVTEAEIQQFLDYGVPNKKITVIPNGIAELDFTSHDTDLFRDQYNLNQKPFVAFLGRLNLIKGPDLLLKSFIQIKDKFPQYHILFIGPDGGLLNELKTIVQSEKIADRIHFIGYLGGSNKSNALHAADLLVIPSRHEAMSIVALEAGICGTPVLLTDQCGFNQLATIGAAWVKPATVEGLTDGLIEILSNTEIRKQASLKIKEFTQQNYSWNSIIKKYTTLFLQIILEAKK